MKPPKQKESGQVSDTIAVPASRYTYKQLAEIYNAARVDYIVPMPMNAKRMQEYVEHYDVDLDGSVVALNSGIEAGVGMLGLRGLRGWITRLGVSPECRRKRIGQFVVDNLMENARQSGVTRMQIEVIVGNEPAHRLFFDVGFEIIRQLLVIRRPPGLPEPNSEFDRAAIEPIPQDELGAYLDRREPGASWVEETPSLLHGGDLEGFRLTLPTCGSEGWVIFQRKPFQLRHFVLADGICNDVGKALLYHVHKKYPNVDTNIENIPEYHHSWDIYQATGYIESFRRDEMICYLNA